MGGCASKIVLAFFRFRERFDSIVRTDKPLIKKGFVKLYCVKSKSNFGATSRIHHFRCIFFIEHFSSFAINKDNACAFGGNSERCIKNLGCKNKKKKSPNFHSQDTLPCHGIEIQ